MTQTEKKKEKAKPASKPIKGMVTDWTSLDNPKPSKEQIAVLNYLDKKVCAIGKGITKAKAVKRMYVRYANPNGVFVMVIPEVRHMKLELYNRGNKIKGLEKATIIDYFGKLLVEYNTAALDRVFGKVVEAYKLRAE
jgi:hypothetical protein